MMRLGTCKGYSRKVFIKDGAAGIPDILRFEVEVRLRSNAVIPKPERHMGSSVGTRTRKKPRGQQKRRMPGKWKALQECSAHGPLRLSRRTIYHDLEAIIMPMTRNGFFFFQRPVHLTFCPSCSIFDSGLTTVMPYRASKKTQHRLGYLPYL